ncbi:hypothetical protein [Bacillus sp. M6-12]|uniref:hypothetical protein n=1 Tax=Bacillus sp. M6-12 TaxID=2054166 RepID=UPI0015E0C6B4|nr:hypothetical protein [Bacillus sp. M6-12]
MFLRNVFKIQLQGWVKENEVVRGKQATIFPVKYKEADIIMDITNKNEVTVSMNLR